MYFVDNQLQTFLFLWQAGFYAWSDWSNVGFEKNWHFLCIFRQNKKKISIRIWSSLADKRLCLLNEVNDLAKLFCLLYFSLLFLYNILTNKHLFTHVCLLYRAGNEKVSVFDTFSTLLQQFSKYGLICWEEKLLFRSAHILWI